jgi:predicted dienelactone hydrolase
MHVRPSISPSALTLVCAATLLLACGDDSPDDGKAEGQTEDGDDETAGEGDTGEDQDTSEDGDPGPSREELIAELSERGPYEVGYKQLELSYIPAGTLEERTIPIQVWYPAMPNSGAPQAIYEVGGIVQLPDNSVGALDAPPIAADGPFPISVYSHGSGGEGLLAYPFGERFASHGWITFSPSHVGNTALDMLAGTASPFIQSAVNRPHDLSQILDEADGGFAGDEVGAAADLSRVFVFGHSFGGYTTFSIGGATLDYAKLLDACTASDCTYLEHPEVAAAFAEGFGDPRVDAIAPQAPALVSMFSDGDLSGLRVAAMLQSGKLDLTTPEATEAAPAWDAISHRNDVWIDLPFGAHYSFITICHDLDPELLALFQPNNLDDGCGHTFTPTTETVPVLTTYLLAFARHEVLGEVQWSALLEGETLHPQVDLLRH